MSHPNPKIAAEIEAAYAERAAQLMEAELSRTLGVRFVGSDRAPAVIADLLQTDSGWTSAATTAEPDGRAR